MHNITELIRENDELSALPFLIVFRTIEILISLGLIEMEKKKTDGVENS